MKMTKLCVVLLPAALLVVPTTLNGRQCILRNGSMEFGEGPGAIDPMVPAFWTEVGVNIERSATVNLVPPGAGHALKAFGDGDSTSVSANQEVMNISPGQSVTASVWLYSPGNDKLGGSGEAGLVLEFLNQFGGTISLYQIYPFNSGSPADTWVAAVLGPYSAPSNTTKVRVTCRLKWSPGNIYGAVYWDDAQLIVNGGSNRLLNGDFETAGHSPGQSPVGIDDWMGFNDQEKSADFAWDGDYSLKVGVDAAYSGLWQNMAVLSAGDRVYLKAWCWIPAAEPLTANSRAGLKLEFSPNGEQPPPIENLAFDENVDPNTWTQVPLSGTVPADATLARVVCIFTGDAYTTGNVYFDSAWAERSSQPGVNKLLNASFETGPGGANGIDNWTEFGTADATTRKNCFSIPAKQGSCVAKSTGPSVTGIWQEIPVVAGETLSTYVWVCTRNTAPLTGPGRAGVKIEWVLGNVPPPVDIGGATNTLDASDPNNVWLPLYIDYTMPAGSNAITRYVDIVERGTALTGRIYFDACEAVVLNKFNGSDADGDDDEDLLDFAFMQRAYSGSGGGLEWMGMVFDNDNDQDVDIADFNYFTPRMTGPAAE